MARRSPDDPSSPTCSWPQQDAHQAAAIAHKHHARARPRASGYRSIRHGATRLGTRRPLLLSEEQRTRCIGGSIAAFPRSAGSEGLSSTEHMRKRPLSTTGTAASKSRIFPQRRPTATTRASSSGLASSRSPIRCRLAPFILTVVDAVSAEVRFVDASVDTCTPTAGQAATTGMIGQ